MLIFSVLLLSIFFNTFFNYLFIKKGLFDTINFRSSHKTQSTRTGGIAIYLTLMVVSTFCYSIGITLFDYSYLVPLSILFFIGLYDDISKADFKLKFIFQIIAAKIIIDNGLLIDNLHGFIGIYELNRLFAQIFTICIIVALVNAINFIDGLDGLAVSVILLFIGCYHFFGTNNSFFGELSIIITSSTLSLYYFNFKKNHKTFLGDSGSLLLGGIASIYSINILTNFYIIKAEYDINKIIFIISILLYPIFDFTRVIFIRIFKKKSPFIADKNHLHHIINSKVKSHFFSVLIIILANIFLIFLTQFTLKFL